MHSVVGVESSIDDVPQFLGNLAMCDAFSKSWLDRVEDPRGDHGVGC